MERYLLKQSAAINAQIADEKVKHFAQYSGVLWLQLHHKISRHALKILFNEYSKAIRAPEASSDLANCKCKIGSTMGLLCHHTIMTKIVCNEPINLEMIDKHWWLDDSTVLTYPRILEPNLVVRRGRPRNQRTSNQSSSQAASTRRDPSHFEYVEAQLNT
jgi:hypothetical protein